MRLLYNKGIIIQMWVHTRPSENKNICQIFNEVYARGSHLIPPRQYS